MDLVSKSENEETKGCQSGCLVFAPRKQRIACLRAAGHLKLQGARQRGRALSFESHLYNFRSVLGKTFLLGCSAYGIAVVSLL